MSSFRFLHCADLHIDSPLRGLEADPDAPAEHIRNATRDAFTALVDHALDQQVDFVVAAGDLYDGDWPDWRTGQFLLGQVGRLSQAGIPFVGIQGNHDAESVITRHLRWGPPAVLLPANKPATHELPDLQVAIHGQSFATRAARDNLALGYPPPRAGWFNIGLLHTSLDGNRPGHADYAPCSVEQLQAHGYDYWALGHIHGREQHGPDPWIVFPGNLQGRHIRETGAKGAVVVTVRDGRAQAPEFISFDTIRWQRLIIDLPHDADEDRALDLARAALLDAVAAADGRLLATRITLRGACRAHAMLSRDVGAVREKLRAEAATCAGPDAVWVENVELLTRPSLDAVGLRQRADATGQLARAIETIGLDSIGSDIQEYCRAMLDRAAGLRGAIGEDHAAVLAAAGQPLPAELLQQARDLLLARLEGRD